jgi:hypothetical protein
LLLFLHVPSVYSPQFTGCSVTCTVFGILKKHVPCPAGVCGPVGKADIIQLNALELQTEISVMPLKSKVFRERVAIGT